MSLLDTKRLKGNAYKNEFSWLFRDEEMQQHFKWQKNFGSCINDNFFKLLKFRLTSKSNTRFCALHVASITLFWFVRFLQTYTYAPTHTSTHRDLNFAIFWKDCEIKYTCNWDNSVPWNLIQVRFKFFLINTSDLRKILSKLREIN